MTPGIFFFLVLLVGLYLVGSNQYVLSMVMFPAIVALVFAKPFDKLQKKLGSKNIAAFLFSSIVPLIIVVFIEYFLPTLIVNTEKFFITVFDYINNIDASFFEKVSLLEKKYSINLFNTVSTKNVLEGLTSDIKSDDIFLLTRKIFSSGQIIIDTGIFIIVCPLLTFSFLKNKETLQLLVVSTFPKRVQPLIKRLMSRVSYVIYRYLFGQIIICLTMSVFYCVFFAIFKVKSWVFLGLVSGFAFLIPYIGSIISFLLVAASVFTQSGDVGYCIFIVSSLLIGHILSSILMAPKLFESTLGVNSNVLIICLIIGGIKMGLMGMLLATPLVSIYFACLNEIFSIYNKSYFYCRLK